jgi:signal peptidase II
MTPSPEIARTRQPARRVVTVFGLVAAAWLALDQITKAVAVRWFADPVDLGFASLVLVRNENAAFGIPGFPGLFLIAMTVLIVLVVRALPRVTTLPVAGAYGLVVGGALGNAVDRVVREPGFPGGAVIDWIHLGPWFPWTFNLADSAITVGATFLVVLLWRSGPEREGEPALPATPVADSES